MDLNFVRLFSKKTCPLFIWPDLSKFRGEVLARTHPKRPGVPPPLEGGGPAGPTHHPPPTLKRNSPDDKWQIHLGKKNVLTSTSKIRYNILKFKKKCIQGSNTSVYHYKLSFRSNMYRFCLKHLKILNIIETHSSEHFHNLTKTRTNIRWILNSNTNTTDHTRSIDQNFKKGNGCE